jgi:hypothetical protein
LKVYIFAGSILLDHHTLDIIFGTLIGIVGIGYVVLEFIPSIEPPANMREADGGLRELKAIRVEAAAIVMGAWYDRWSGFFRQSLYISGT